MLATLTGTAPFSLTGFADADEAWAEHETESADTDEASDQADESAAPETDAGAASVAQDSDDDAEGDSEVAEEESLARGRT